MTSHEFSDCGCDIVCIWYNDNFLTRGCSKNQIQVVFRVWLQDNQFCLLECYMDWFPSLICKNYIFKHFVKTVEPTSLKFCMVIELITLHLEYTIAQVKYANFSYAHAQTFVLLNGEMATVSTGFRKLKFCLWLLRTVVFLSQTGFWKIY